MKLVSRIFRRPTREEFAKSIVDEVRERGETRSVIYDPERFRLTAKGEPVLLIGHVRAVGEVLPNRTILALTKFYDEYLALAARARPEAFRRYVDRWFTLPTEPIDDRAQLAKALASVSPEALEFFRTQFGAKFDTLLGALKPLPQQLKVNINVPFEAEIKGDSLELATLLATISSLSDVPVKRGMGVTGAVNIYGDVLAVDFVNEKVRGWFELCSAAGLNGEQGAVIPKANENNLRQSDDVLDAVRKGLFNIYLVDRVDQAIEIMTERSASSVLDRVRETLFAGRKVSTQPTVNVIPIDPGGTQE